MNGIKYILLLPLTAIPPVISSQNNPNVTRETYQNVCGGRNLDTLNKVFIKGRIFETQKGRIETDFLGAFVVVKGTKVFTKAEKDGYYMLDITSVADTAKAIVLQCGFINYLTQEIRINEKIIKNTFINFDLKPSSGIEHPEQKIRKPKQ